MFANWKKPADVFESMKAVSVGQPCDISGIDDYEMLDRCGGLQWPFTAEHAAALTSNETGGEQTEIKQRRLFADGLFHHPDQRAKFIFDAPTGAPESPDDKYQFWLLTGRGTAAQWHTQTRTSKSAVLRALYPQNVYCELNPVDAARLGVESNDLIDVTSRRGTIRVAAFVSSVVRRGSVFIPMHYEVTNRLTLAHFDPYSRQPSYKDCAVSITRCGHPLNTSGV